MGFFKAKNGNLTLGYFKNARLTSFSGFFIRFFADEDFVGILRKVHVRGFQHVEAGTLVKLNGPSFCGIFDYTSSTLHVNYPVSRAIMVSYEFVATFVHIDA